MTTTCAAPTAAVATRAATCHPREPDVEASHTIWPPASTSQPAAAPPPRPPARPADRLVERRQGVVDAMAQRRVALPAALERGGAVRRDGTRRPDLAQLQLRRDDRADLGAARREGERLAVGRREVGVDAIDVGAVLLLHGLQPGERALVLGQRDAGGRA